MLNFLKEKNIYIILLILLIVFPFLPFVGRYFMQIAILCLIYSIGTLTLNLFLGYTGQLSLGHGAFFGIGGYTVAILTTQHEWAFWAAIPLAGIFAAIGGLIFGLPALRTRGAYFAVSTLAFGVIAYVVAGAWIDLTGGYTGIVGIPRPEGFFGLDFQVIENRYFLALVLVILTLVVLHRLIYSLQGYDFMACRNNEVLAEAVGINAYVAKLISFSTANFIVGIGGGFYASFMGTMSPETIHYSMSFVFLIQVMLGGMGSMAGPVIGAFVVTILLEYFHAFGPYRYIFFGVVVIIMTIYASYGLVGLYNSNKDKITSLWKKGEDKSAAKG